MAKGGARSNDRGHVMGSGGKMMGKAADGGSHPVIPHMQTIPTGKASQAGSSKKGLPPGFKRGKK